jgi:hypothetical protein
MDSTRFPVDKKAQPLSDPPHFPAPASPIPANARKPRNRCGTPKEAFKMNRWTQGIRFSIHYKARQMQFAVLFVGIFLLTVSQRGVAAADAETLDAVVFVNGDRLSGHLKVATRDSVTFSGLVTGDVSLNWKDIKELTLTSSKISISNSQNPQGFPATGPVIEVTATDLCVRVKTQYLQTFPISQLISASVLESSSPPAAPKSPEQNPYFKAVGGALKVSPESVIRATQKQIQLAGVFDLGLVTNSDRAFKHQATNIALEANYSDSRKPGGAAVITELYSGTIQQNFYITGSHHSCEHCSDVSTDGPYLYGITNFYHNLSLGMNLAQSYGAGIGWDGDRGRSSYTLAADIRYLGEELYAPGKPLSLAVAGLGEQYSYTFPWPSDGLNVYERILFLPAFDNSHAFQVRGTTGLDVPISKDFSFDVDLLDDYIRNAPPKSLQNFAKITFSLKYAIGAKPASH